MLLALAGCGGATFQPMGEPVATPMLDASAIIAADRVPLSLKRWMPEDSRPRAVILALHGFNDYSNAFDMPGRWWAERGIATYAYDQRGFGQAGRPGIWATADTLVADLHGAVAAVRNAHPGLPVYLLGESMGGAVILTALAEPPPAGYGPLAERVDGAILSAPAVWGRDSLNPFYRFVLWFGSNAVPWMKVTAPRELDIVPSDNIEMLRALALDPLVLKETRVDAVSGLVDLMSRAENAVQRPAGTRVLMMFGRNEQVIPGTAVAKALRQFGNGPDRSVAVYGKGYHMLLRDRQAATVWQDVLSWIDDPTVPLPSGADRVPWETAGR